jgi:hypothetical protein
MPFTKGELLERLDAIRKRLAQGLTAEDRATFTLTVRWCGEDGRPTAVTWSSKRRTT